MKTFKQLRSMAEARATFKIKGWIHPQKKIILQHDNGRLPYHIGMVMKNLRKFDLTKKKIGELKGLTKDNLMLDTHINDLTHGILDVDKDIEGYLKEKGWCRFYLDNYAFAFTSYRMEDTKNGMKLYFEENPTVSVEMGGTLYSEISSERFATLKDAIYFATTGRKPKRTSIGSTMAQFR